MKSRIIVEIAMTYLPDLGGGETQLKDLVSYLSKYYDVVVITMKPYQNRSQKVSFVEKQGRVTIIRLPRPFRSLIYRRNESRTLANLVYLPLFMVYVLVWSIKHRKEVLAYHLHGVILSPLCVLIKSISRKRCVISIHFTFKGLNKLVDPIIKWSLAKADCVLALSELEKNNLIKFGLPGEKVKRFTYWVDQELFRPIDRDLAREKLGIDKSAFVVLFVGRLIKEKGVHLVLELGNRMKDAEFYIVGIGPLAEDVIRAARELKNVHYVGPLDNSSLPIWYNASNVLIIPSINEEGFGRVIIEALSCGIPVIGSNLGGIPEAITSLHVGKVVRPTPDDFEIAIREIMASSYSREEIRKYAEERFSIKNAETILECLTGK